MPITTDLETEIGQIRLLLGDDQEGDGVKPDGANFSDAELSYFYERGKSIEEAAALVCETLAWLWNIHPSFEADGLRVDRHEVSQGWWRAAVRLRSRKGAKLISAIRQDAYSQATAASQASDAVDGEELD